MMQPGDKNGWNEYSRFVLKELERLNANFEKLHSDFQVQLIEITTLKTKAAMWGSLGGMIPVIVNILLDLKSK